MAQLTETFSNKDIPSLGVKVFKQMNKFIVDERNLNNVAYYLSCLEEKTLGIKMDLSSKTIRSIELSLDQEITLHDIDKTKELLKNFEEKLKLQDLNSLITSTTKTHDSTSNKNKQLYDKIFQLCGTDDLFGLFRKLVITSNCFKFSVVRKANLINYFKMYKIAMERKIDKFRKHTEYLEVQGYQNRCDIFREISLCKNKIKDLNNEIRNAHYSHKDHILNCDRFIEKREKDLEFEIKNIKNHFVLETELEQKLKHVNVSN